MKRVEVAKYLHSYFSDNRTSIGDDQQQGVGNALVDHVDMVAAFRGIVHERSEGKYSSCTDLDK